MSKWWVFAAILALAGSSAMAQEWVLTAGFADFSREISDDSALVGFEYHYTPFHEGAGSSAAWAASGTVHTTGDIFVGIGLVASYQLDKSWFLEASVMPGMFVENADINDLGSTFEIRSLLALGYELNSGNALSLALTHKSNANTASINPGVNSFLLRWHLRD